MFKAVVKKEETDGHLANSSVVNVNEEPSDNDAETSSDNECRNTPTEPSLPSSNRRYNLRKRTTNVPHYDAREARNGSDDDEYDDYDVVSDVEDENVSGARSRPKRYKCTQCDFRASYPCDVKAHSRIHTGERPFACSKCHKRFRTKGLVREHMMTHVTERRHECDQCDYSSKNRRTLYYHQRTKHGMGDIVTCPHEGCTFFHAKPSAVNDWAEMECVVIDEESRSVNGGSPSIWDDDDDEHGTSTSKNGKQGKLRCPQWPNCPYTTTRPDYMKRHQAVHDDTQRPFTCENCGKGFTQKHILDVHMAVHSDEKPFACADCDCRYKRRHELTTHRRKHTGEVLKCPQCDFTTWKDGRMSKHKALKHREEKPFACGRCDRRFVLASLLWRHERDNCNMNSANGYACSQCDYVAKAAGSLTVHVRKSHPASGDAKPSKCSS